MSSFESKTCDCDKLTFSCFFFYLDFSANQMQKLYSYIAWWTERETPGVLEVLSRALVWFLVVKIHARTHTHTHLKWFYIQHTRCYVRAQEEEKNTSRLETLRDIWACVSVLRMYSFTGKMNIERGVAIFGFWLIKWNANKKKMFFKCYPQRRRCLKRHFEKKKKKWVESGCLPDLLHDRENERAMK